MIPILIVNAAEYIVLELRKEAGQVFIPQSFKRLLYHPTTIHLKGQLYHLALQRITDSGLDVARPKVQKLLNDIVTKNVVAKPSNCRKHLIHNNLLLVKIFNLQPLLDKAGTVLVLTKLDDISNNLVHRPIAILRRSKFVQQWTTRRVALGFSASSMPSTATSASATSSMLWLASRMASLVLLLLPVAMISWTSAHALHCDLLSVHNRDRWDAARYHVGVFSLPVGSILNRHNRHILVVVADNVLDNLRLLGLCSKRSLLILHSRSIAIA